MNHSNNLFISSKVIQGNENNGPETKSELFMKKRFESNAL